MEIGPKANAQSFPDKTAIVVGETRYTWAEWNARMCRLAQALRSLGLARGDKIAMMLHNCHQFLEVGQAAAKLGLTTVPINYRLRGQEVQYILDNSDARALVCGPEFVAELVTILDDLPGLVPGGLIATGDERAPRFTLYEELLAAHAPTEPSDQPPPGLNAMTYTSGTTGRPKGVHRAGGVDPAILLDIVQALGLQLGDEVHLVPAPLYHSAPGLGAALAIALGGTLVVMPRFEPEPFLETIARERVTSSFVVPTILKRTLALPVDVRGRYDMSSLRSLIVGAAPFPLETKKATVAYFGSCLYEYYGSTDAGLNTVLPPADQLTHPASCGKVLAGNEILILDDDGTPRPVGEVGNIYITNPLVKAMQYYKDPEKTRQAFRGEHMTVGDMGYLDADGYLYIVDRKTDMVISGGVNIYPAEIEETIHEHPDVLDVAVVGVPNEEWGEELKAVVQLKPGSTADASALIAFCRARLADYKQPRSVDFVAEVPRNPSGKLLKREIRAPYWEGQTRRV